MPLTDAFIPVLAFLGYFASLLMLGALLLTFVETLIKVVKEALRNVASAYRPPTSPTDGATTEHTL